MSAVLLLALAAAAGVSPPVVLDDFSAVDGWRAVPADGVVATVTAGAGLEGGGLRLDYDFRGRAGWAAVRRDLDLELTPNWQLELAVRGTPATQRLEIKLLDPSGDNVWWQVWPELHFDGGWQRLVVRKRTLSFAWGPAGGGEPERVGAIEIAVVAGEGGAGSVWLDDLVSTPLPPERPYAGTPIASASSSAAGMPPARALDGDPGTAWSSAAGATTPIRFEVDFGERRELGGLTLDWAAGRAPAAFSVALSDDGATWRDAWRVDAAHGKRSWVELPDEACRFARLELEPGAVGAVGLRELAVLAADATVTANDFMAMVAGAAPRGRYPRGVRGEMTAWTVVAPAAGGRRALLGADGAFEPVAREGSLEPLVEIDGALLTWADVTLARTLADGRLPVPSVTWTAPELSLEVTAAADAGGDLLRYRLSNRTSARLAPRLVLAVRPFQVNPPSQFLNGPGGVARPATVACGGGGIAYGDAWRATATPPPAGCGAVGFDGGDVVQLLADGELPTAPAAGPPYASGALRWQLDLAPGGSAEVLVAVAATAADGDGPQDVATRLVAAEAAWREQLAGIALEVPPAGREVVDTLAANVGWMLANRAGPALEPGARAYARSWIRDGAMMSAALLRLGFGPEVAAYARWFAAFQYPDGRVPCCVDGRGADPVPENDSDGELIYLVAETWRQTGDLALAGELWPHVARAADHVDALRAQRRGAEYRTPGKLVYFGLVPESISHEGYSSKPRHSYWDDFWAWRGLADAAELAAALGRDGDAAHFAASAAELRQDLVASLERAMRQHDIDYLPGCAELGDFDPTSTTVAVAPTGFDRYLPADALRTTFERAWRGFVARRDGAEAWEAYTPYELRQVGVFVRLGWRERAWQLLESYLADRQPPGWRQWPEIVWHDRERARFLGDLPHTWVGSDFVRALLDVFAWERERDGALVVAGGVPAEWLEDGGVRVRGLGTRWGPVGYRLWRDGDRVRLSLDAGLTVPPGGIVLQPPLAGPPAVVTEDGRAVGLTAGEIVIHEVPAEVVIAAAGGGGGS